MLLRLGVLLTCAAVVSLASGTGQSTAPQARAAQQYRIALSAIASDAGSGATFDLGTNAAGVRYCRFLPGVSTPAPMPPEVVSPPPPAPRVPAAIPSPSAVSASVTAQQVAIFEELWQAIQTQYVDPAFNGNTMDELRARYLGLVNGGLTTADFHRLMAILIDDLDDDHSRFQTPAEVVEETRRLAEGQNYVGIGALVSPVEGTTHVVIITVMPSSPAEAAGLRAHDMIVDVGGLPPTSADGTNNVRGLPGTVATVRIRRQGGPDFIVDIPRKAITGSTPADFCFIPGTRIGYILVPTFFDNTIDDNVRAALQEMTADGPLAGLILDNRMNGGGLSTVALQVLGFFTSGLQGQVVLRSSSEAFNVVPEDIGGSQSVPLVVLTGRKTVSFGEITSGVLQRSGRAKVIGDTTLGNVELLNAFTFSDGSRAWLATRAFQPNGLPAGVWEETGIVPDYPAPARWDLFTEFDDPALVRAVQVLGAK